MGQRIPIAREGLIRMAHNAIGVRSVGLTKGIGAALINELRLVSKGAAPEFGLSPQMIMLMLFGFIRTMALRLSGST